MADRVAAEALSHPITLQEVIQKAHEKGLKEDDVWRYVVKGSQRSNANVDATLGLSR
ncbi:MAG: hypothetical protein HZB23_01395 [Deltaproteobacteria bacterium]|nr:hypothetical protein [Deltaproteobacteria bacterium]